MAVTVYHVEPDLAVGQLVLQLAPATVPLTVTEALSPSFTMIDEDVEAADRTLTLLQAGASTAGVAPTGVTAASRTVIAATSAVTYAPRAAGRVRRVG